MFRYLYGCTTAALLLFATPTQADVFVEATQSVIGTNHQIPGIGYMAWPLKTQSGTTLYIDVSVSGGIDNALQAWLVDLTGYEQFKTRQRFRYWPTASGKIMGKRHFTFVAPGIGLYYLVLDNRANLLARNVRLDVIAEASGATPFSQALSQMYQNRYAGLRKMFAFPDFNIGVKRCGQANAWSTPNILICSELIDVARAQRAPGIELFTFYHEVGHSLLNLWGYPGNDNEDTADEFATVFLIITNRQTEALEAAQWWASHDSKVDAKMTLLHSNRHSLSIQRARNIIHWLNNGSELVRRWASLLIPKMTTEVLRHLSDREAPAVLREPEILAAAAEELRRRAL